MRERTRARGAWWTLPYLGRPQLATDRYTPSLTRSKRPNSETRAARAAFTDFRRSGAPNNNSAARWTSQARTGEPHPPQPVEHRQVFGRSAQQTAVQMAVVEVGDQGVAGEIDTLSLDLLAGLGRADAAIRPRSTSTAPGWSRRRRSASSIGSTASAVRRVAIGRTLSACPLGRVCRRSRRALSVCRSGT